MTLDEFASLTRKVIGQNGFDDFLPVACFPRRFEIRTLTGLPGDGDPEPAVLAWAANLCQNDQEYLVAFKIGQREFKIIRTSDLVTDAAIFSVEDS